MNMRYAILLVFSLLTTSCVNQPLIPECPSSHPVFCSSIVVLQKHIAVWMGFAILFTLYALIQTNSTCA